MLEDNYILRNAKEKIEKFDRIGLHYNLVANQVDETRLQEGTDPFNQSYARYIVAGLISFDMGRMMGKRKYDTTGDSFSIRLNYKLDKIKHLLEPLMDFDLTQINLQQHKHAIIKAYEILSANNSHALNEDSGKHFHVGTTKILHFLNPSLFIIVDSNAARAYREAHNVKFRKGTQPGYSSERYVECMEFAQQDMLTYGTERFEALDPSTPITRIYDKLTFVSGDELK